MSIPFILFYCCMQQLIVTNEIKLHPLTTKQPKSFIDANHEHCDDGV